MVKQTEESIITRGSEAIVTALKKELGFIAVLGSGIALIVGGKALMEKFDSSPSKPHKAPVEKIEGKPSYKTYIVQPGDTEWAIAERAFPDKDPREVYPSIDDQLPKDKAHKNHTLQPGDVIKLSANADLGTPNS